MSRIPMNNLLMTSVGGRLPKIMMYLGLVGAYYKCEKVIKEDSVNEMYKQTVLLPFHKKESSDCFYQMNEIRSMNRAFLIKLTQLEQDSKSLKKYKFDP